MEGDAGHRLRAERGVWTCVVGRRRERAVASLAGEPATASSEPSRQPSCSGARVPEQSRLEMSEVPERHIGERQEGYLFTDFSATDLGTLRRPSEPTRHESYYFFCVGSKRRDGPLCVRPAQGVCAKCRARRHGK